MGIKDPELQKYEDRLELLKLALKIILGVVLALLILSLIGELLLS